MYIKNYRVLNKIATGGMADVLLAIQDSLSRKVAIKIIHKELSENVEMIKRFKREAELVAKLKHPNIVQIYEDGVFEGRYYMILEYMENGSLDNFIKRVKPDLKKVLNYLVPIFSALEFIHSKGIVHRDLKPSNILLDKDLTTKLTDFGIATFLWTGNTRITTTNTAIGTIAYMSPEQSQDSKRVDHRSDIYSMGVILYELTTGMLPSGNFPPPHMVNPEISESLSNAIMKALNLDRMKRYPSIKLLKDKILEYLKDKDDGSKSTVRINEDIATSKDTGNESDFSDMLRKFESNSSLTEKLSLKNKLKNSVTDKHLPLIQDKLKNSSGPLKEALLLSLSNIESKESFDLLATYLKDPFYKEIAAEALLSFKNSNLRDLGIKKITELLELPCEKIYKILAILNKNRIKEAKNRSLECLKSESKKIKSDILNSLEGVIDKEDKKHLKFLINSEKDPDIKAKLKILLEKI